MMCGWSTPHPGRFIRARATEPVAIVYEVAWAPEPVRTGAEYLAPAGIRSPDLPARS
jgi:hypothetical protein